MHDEITAAGATLVALSPQIPKFSVRITKRHKLAFDVLADPGNQVAEAFGLKFAFPDELKEVYTGTFKIDFAEYNGDDSWTMPVPARFVIASNGKIVTAEADPDYTRRPEPSSTVEVLQSLG